MTKQEYMDMYDVIGIAMEIHNNLGRGMAEQIYQEAYAIEAKLRGLDIEREKKLQLTYKGVELQKIYYADFYYNGIIIEFKSVEEICSEHRAQLLNYMRIAKVHMGLLINFGEINLHSERYLYQPDDDSFVLLTHDNYKSYITD
ncbi:MAG: GxxExxY protein [Bacteroidales bacterium]|jgi:GxxExxY protein|nr:GxxExxY protein [Bacteroidales bacterium]